MQEFSFVLGFSWLLVVELKSEERSCNGLVDEFSHSSRSFDGEGEAYCYNQGRGGGGMVRHCALARSDAASYRCS
eukprot:scaffold30021_cov31-Tisochrysis_lutea.AAC.2